MYKNSLEAFMAVIFQVDVLWMVGY